MCANSCASACARGQTAEALLATYAVSLHSNCHEPMFACNKQMNIQIKITVVRASVQIMHTLLMSMNGCAGACQWIACILVLSSAIVCQKICQ